MQYGRYDLPQVGLRGLSKANGGRGQTQERTLEVTMRVMQGKDCLWSYRCHMVNIMSHLSVVGLLREGKLGNDPENMRMRVGYFTRI